MPLPFKWPALKRGCLLFILEPYARLLRRSPTPDADPDPHEGSIAPRLWGISHTPQGYPAVTACPSYLVKPIKEPQPEGQPTYKSFNINVMKNYFGFFSFMA